MSGILFRVYSCIAYSRFTDAKLLLDSWRSCFAATLAPDAVLVGGGASEPPPPPPPSVIVVVVVAAWATGGSNVTEWGRGLSSGTCIVSVRTC
jgi:hypothetical protein